MQVRISDALDKQACVAVTQAEDFYMHWNEENKEAIDDYNRRIESLGTFGDGRRLF